MLGITMTNLIPAIRPDQHGGGHLPMEATRNVFWASMYFTALGECCVWPPWWRWWWCGASPIAVA